MDSFVGEIRIFGFPFAPDQWAFCDGAILPVQQNPALYAVIGNRYGGTPNSTFALPDLRSRAALGAPTPPGVGVVTGSDQATVNLGQLGPHNHALNAHAAAKPADQSASPTANVSFLSRLVTPAVAPATTEVLRPYSKPQPGVVPDCTLSDATVGPAGNGQPHENRQPCLALNFCISLAGEFPIKP